MNIESVIKDLSLPAGNIFFGSNSITDPAEENGPPKRNHLRSSSNTAVFECSSPNFAPSKKKSRPGSSLLLTCPNESSNNSVASLSPRSPGHTLAIHETFRTSAVHLLDISRSQLQLARRRIQNAKSIEEEVEIWKEFNETPVVTAIANLCLQGIDLMKGRSRENQPTYASAAAKSPTHSNVTPSIDSTNQIVMKPKVSLQLSTTHYFWEAILNKGIQVAGISKSDTMTITITLHDYANARHAQDILTTAKIDGKSYSDLFEILLRSEATYFIKTQRIIPEELMATGILSEDGIDRKKLTDALATNNPMWFDSDQDFDILESVLLPAEGSMVSGYVIKLVVQKSIFKKFVSRPRPSLMLGRFITPVRPCMRIDQCFKCLNYGHPTNTCIARRVCRRCGRRHNHSHTKCILEKRCYNCSKNIDMNDSIGAPRDDNSLKHQATSNTCPMNRARMEELIDQIKNESSNE